LVPNAAFIRRQGKIGFGYCPEYLIDVEKMLLKGLRENDDIVDVYKGKV
jgi:hypothetical protein